MPNRPQVLHLLSWFPRPTDPNSGNFCLKHIRAVSQFTDSVVLSCYIDDSLKKGKKLEIEHYENFDYVIVKIARSKSKYYNKWKIFKSYIYGFTYIKKHYFKPNLIHQHVTLPVGNIAIFLHYFCKIPYVLTEHWCIYQPHYKSTMTFSMLHNIRLIANHAAMIMPVSHDLQNKMQDYGISAPFQVIPNVVDTSLFCPKEKNYANIKHILHVSTLRDTSKNFSGILRVIEKLAKQRQDFVLDVIHDYPCTDFEQFVHEHHLQNFVLFHGKKSEKEVSEWMQQSCFLLLFSNVENLPCVIIEALACGIPIVTTDVGGIPEIMNEERGILLSAKDEPKLLQSVDYMLSNYQNFDKKQIRSYAEKHFSQPIIGKMIMGVYEKV